jgi:F-type H+-transporting ATPase subunit b
MGSAWAADKAAEIAIEGGDHGLLGNPETWVAVAFLLFVVLLGKVMWTRITALLDKRSAAIAKALSNAETLRVDALKAKTEAEATLARATVEAEGIIGQAREEAERMRVKAMASLEAAVALRQQQALDRISQAEAQATKDVRDHAVDVAIAATRALLRDQVGGGQTQSLVDEAIAELPRRLH